MSNVPYIPKRKWAELGRKRRRHWYRQINRAAGGTRCGKWRINPAYITAEYYIKFPTGITYIMPQRDHL